LALDPVEPFDFLVHGILLRQPLDVFLSENNISAESTLTIEYIPLIKPPEQSRHEPHDDWVSAVSGLPTTTSGRKSVE